MLFKSPSAESLGSIDQFPNLFRCTLPKFRRYRGKIHQVNGAHGWEQLHRLRQLAAQGGTLGGGFQCVSFVAEIEIRSSGCEWPRGRSRSKKEHPRPFLRETLRERMQFHAKAGGDWFQHSHEASSWPPKAARQRPRRFTLGAVQFYLRRRRENPVLRPTREETRREIARDLEMRGVTSLRSQ